jgi:hypothetical protein
VSTQHAHEIRYNFSRRVGHAARRDADVMSRFGQYLCDQGVLTQQQLEEALSHQSVYGARLGTTLVELHMISIEQLAEQLSSFHKVPLPPRNWLQRPQKAAIKKVTRPMVERIRFIPLRADRNVLHCAVLDPTDPSCLDNLRFATGCKIEPYVLPEIWMHDWLLTLFKIPRGIRHVETDGMPDDDTPNGEAGGFDFSAAQAAAATGPGAPADARPYDAQEPATRVQAPPPAPAQRHVRETSKTQPGLPVSAVPFDEVAIPGMPAPRRSRAQRPPTGSVAEAQQTDAEPGAESAGSGVLPDMSAIAKLAGMSAAGAMPAAEHGAAVHPPVAPGDPDFQSAAGASVRPPPITVQSLADLASAMGSADSVADPLPGDSFWEQAPAPSVDWDAEPGLPPLPEPAPREQPGLPPLPEPQAQQPGLPPLQTRDDDADDGPEVVDDDEAPARAADPRALQQLEQALAAIEDRDALIASAFELAEHFASCVALFIVQKGMVQGAQCTVDGQPRAIEGVLVTLDSPSMLSQVARGGEPAVVDPHEGDLDQRLLTLMGQQDTSQVALFPVKIGSRVVNVLYASNGDAGIGTIASAALGALAERMGDAYQQLIMARKKS